MIDIPKKVEARRSVYNSLPSVLRVVIVTIAFLMGAVGLVFVFTPPPFFDLGVLALLLSLSVLSFQFVWAHTLLTYVTNKLADKVFRKKLFAVIGVITLLIVSLVIYLFMYKH